MRYTCFWHLLLVIWQGNACAFNFKLYKTIYFNLEIQLKRFSLLGYIRNRLFLMKYIDK